MPSDRMADRRQDANRRYQQSESGATSHRRCQQCYRDLALRPQVTDHGAVRLAVSIPEPLPTSTSTLGILLLCAAELDA
jgi:hypothetical protein